MGQELLGQLLAAPRRGPLERRYLVCRGTADRATSMSAGTRLRDALSARRFAVTAKLSPPRGADAESIRRAARVLHDWVDAANVTDNQGAMVRLSSLAGSVIA